MRIEKGKKAPEEEYFLVVGGKRVSFTVLAQFFKTFALAGVLACAFFLGQLAQAENQKMCIYLGGPAFNVSSGRSVSCLLVQDGQSLYWNCTQAQVFKNPWTNDYGGKG